MKSKFVLVSSVCLVTIVLTITLLYPFDKTNIEKNQIISVEFSPSIYDGLYRGNDKKAINLTTQDFTESQKIKILLDHALDVPIPMSKNDQIREGITIVNDSNEYYLIQTGPFSIKGETYLTYEEFNKYQLWADENLTAIPIYNDVPHHIVKYDGEVFIIKFNSTSVKINFN